MPLFEEMGDMMKTIHKCQTGIITVVLICLLVTGTVSAYDTNIACKSANETITETENITELELVAFYSDYSLRQFKIWTECILNPEESVCGQIYRYIEERDAGVELSEMILTTVAGDERVSYKLSPETSMFVKMPEPIDFPDPKRYADKMMLYFKITGYGGKGTNNNDVSSLNPENIFRSHYGLTPASILSDLSGRQRRDVPASALLTNTALRLGITVKNTQTSQVGAGNPVATDVLAAHRADGDFASKGSGLIESYRHR